MKNKFILGIAIGLMLGVIAMGFIFAKRESAIKPSIKWVMENPKYADLLKKNYDTYMKTAEDVFYKTIESSGGLK